MLPGRLCSRWGWVGSLCVCAGRVFRHPLGVGEGVGEIVTEAIRVVRDSGLPNQTDAMFTVIEGDTWAEVMAVVQRAVEAVAARAPRVSAVIKVDWRPGVTDAMTQKVATVERYLLRPE